jgi:hypothetical protein
MQLDRSWRNQLLMAAGFAPDGLERRPVNLPEMMFTPAEALQEIASYSWPSFVVSERVEVIAANDVAQRLWGIDLFGEFGDPISRNLLSVASNPRFANRCVNWDEAVGVIISTFKAFPHASESMDEPSPYMSAVLAHFLEGDPKYIRRFVELWQRAPSDWPNKIRWSYPVVWKEPEAGIMRFHCIVSNMNETEGFSVNDWIPRDADTWTALDGLRRSAKPMKHDRS